MYGNGVLNSEYNIQAFCTCLIIIYYIMDFPNQLTLPFNSDVITADDSFSLSEVVVDKMANISSVAA